MVPAGVKLKVWCLDTARWVRWYLDDKRSQNKEEEM
jgi:hypothetical protein